MRSVTMKGMKNKYGHINCFKIFIQMKIFIQIGSVVVIFGEIVKSLCYLENLFGEIVKSQI